MQRFQANTILYKGSEQPWILVSVKRGVDPRTIYPVGTVYIFGEMEWKARLVACLCPQVFRLILFPSALRHSPGC